MSTNSEVREFVEALRERFHDARRVAPALPRAAGGDLGRAELEAERRFYRELFDLAPAACLVTTPEGRITHANHVSAPRPLVPQTALGSTFPAPARP